MSIQSSVNTAIGSLAIFGRMRSTEARQKAMMELNKQKVAISQQRADTEARKLEIKKETSPIYAQVTLQRERNKRYALGTERLKVKQGGLTNEQK